MAQNNRDGKMSREEAGRKGGEETSRTHDREFYQEIGQKGGEETSRTHDREFYQEIGQKGGESRGNNGNQNRNDSRGSEDDGKMSREEAGRKGGEARARQRDNS
ncbi:KGG domain-containing protein [Paenibacillus puerhi]|uniref:KGG domain-containing protein n=1 Tax=Paenibacillus puerhi TaxID=2692622 RepID=UPI00135BA38F|nr:general stress protein [Paenibacillus puerhi]